MTKLLFLFIVLIAAGNTSYSQTEDVKTLHQTAKTYMRQGDYNNAVLVLNRALRVEPENLELLKDLSFSYYLKHDYANALTTAKPLADRKDADVQTYQIIAMVYKSLEERKEAEKLYKTALKKFPNSGVLYNEYGEMLWSKKDFSDAIKLWEKGILSDPNSAGNYYNAAKFYYLSADKTWALIYGEMFVNLESYTKRTEEVKTILLEGYKKLFSTTDIFKGQNTKNEFVNAFLGIMQKNSTAVATGITPETITTLRSRFLMEWQQQYAKKFPHRLFEHQNQLLGMGLFDAYNQWIFGAAASKPAYQQWTSNNTAKNDELVRLQKNRVFKIPHGQYYQTLPK